MSRRMDGSVQRSVLRPDRRAERADNVRALNGPLVFQPQNPRLTSTHSVPWIRGTGCDRYYSLHWQIYIKCFNWSHVDLIPHDAAHNSHGIYNKPRINESGGDKTHKLAALGRYAPPRHGLDLWLARELRWLVQWRSRRLHESDN